MWTAIAGFWARQRALALVVIVGLLGAGAFTYVSLVARDGFPAIALPVVIVTVDHDEATPLDADAAVAAPLNEIIVEVDDVLEVRTTSAAESVTSVVFTSSGGDSAAIAREISDAAESQGLSVTATASSFDTLGFTIAVASSRFSPAELDGFAAALSSRLVESESVLGATPAQNFGAGGERLGFAQVAQRGSDGTFDSRPVVTISLQKPADVDTLTFSDEVNELLDDTLRNEGLIPEHVSFTSIGDEAPATRSQISGLETSLLQSLVIVAAMVFLLVSWRAAVVAALFVPTVMGGTVLALHLAGATLNTISMFGLLLVLGLFIDDIIVVVEAIDHEHGDGSTGVEAVERSVQRIGSADLMGSLTTIAVFTPLLFLPGLLGEFVIQLPLAVILALTLSVVLALTAFLWLAAFLVADPSPSVADRYLGRVSAGGGAVIGRLRGGLERVVGGYLKSKVGTTVAGAIGLVAIVLGTGVAANLDLDIFPSPDDAPTLSLTASFNGATHLDDAAATVTALETQIVTAVGPDVDRVVFSDVDVLGGSIQLDLAADRTSSATEIASTIETALAGFGPASVTEATSAPPPTAAFLIDETAELDTLVAAVPRFVTGLPETEFGAVAPTSVLVSRWNNSPAAVAEIVVSPAVDLDDLLDGLGARAARDGLGVGITADHVDTSDPITEDQENSFGAMGLVFILSIFTIACLLVVQFRSLLLPGVILMAVPLALPLLFPGLLSVGADLSFFVMLGISALIGIAVNNSIMLIDYANQEIRRGAEPVAAIMEALHIRFRPLVIAALTTVVGVYPLTTDPQFSGLAWTVIFGLVSSTVLVVTVFPAYYVMVQTPRSAVARWRHRRRDSVSA